MSGTTWVYIMLGIYIIYCFYWGLKGYFSEKTSAGYAIAGRSIPFIAFLMAATAASRMCSGRSSTRITLPAHSTYACSMAWKR